VNMKFQAVFLKSHDIIEVEARNQNSAISIVGRNIILSQGYCPKFRIERV